PHQMKRRRQRATAQPDDRSAGFQDGDVEAWLNAHAVPAPESAEQRAVGVAATQEHVLSVVHLKALALERVRRPAEPAPDLDEPHAGARGGAVKRGADPGET